MHRAHLARAALTAACAALVIHARSASTQVVPPPRTLVFDAHGAIAPRAVPVAPPTPVIRPSCWTDDELRARPWLRGQTSPGCLGPAHQDVLHDASLDEGPLADRLTAVGRAYITWGRVDDELRWAPWLCRQPSPSSPRLSTAPAGGHSEKVYFLYARDRTAYTARRPSRLQVVVKESWTHRPVDLAHATQVHGEALVARTPDGSTVEPDSAAGLFVMMRVDARDPRSDRGWIYGTVAPDGAVTSAGRVASCMGCHVEAGPGRLFGLAQAARRRF